MSEPKGNGSPAAPKARLLVRQHENRERAFRLTGKEQLSQVKVNGAAPQDICMFPTGKVADVTTSTVCERYAFTALVGGKQEVCEYPPQPVAAPTTSAALEPAASPAAATPGTEAPAGSQPVPAAHGDGGSDVTKKRNGDEVDELAPSTENGALKPPALSPAIARALAKRTRKDAPARTDAPADETEESDDEPEVDESESEESETDEDEEDEDPLVNVRKSKLKELRSRPDANVVRALEGIARDRAKKATLCQILKPFFPKENLPKTLNELEELFDGIRQQIVKNTDGSITLTVPKTVAEETPAPTPHPPPPPAEATPPAGRGKSKGSGLGW